MNINAITPVVPPPVAVAEDQPQSAGTEAVATIQPNVEKPETPPEVSSGGSMGVLMPASGMATFTHEHMEDKAADARRLSNFL